MFAYRYKIESKEEAALVSHGGKHPSLPTRLISTSPSSSSSSSAAAVAAAVKTPLQSGPAHSVGLCRRTPSQAPVESARFPGRRSLCVRACALPPSIENTRLRPLPRLPAPFQKLSQPEPDPQPQQDAAGTGWTPRRCSSAPPPPPSRCSRRAQPSQVGGAELSWLVLLLLPLLLLLVVCVCGGCLLLLGPRPTSCAPFCFGAPKCAGSPPPSPPFVWNFLKLTQDFNLKRNNVILRNSRVSKVSVVLYELAIQS